MKKPPKFVLFLGVLGSLAALFNFYQGQEDWWFGLISLVSSLGLIIAYYATKEKAEQQESN